MEVVFQDNDGIWLGWVDCSILWRSTTDLNQTYVLVSLS